MSFRDSFNQLSLAARATILAALSSLCILSTVAYATQIVTGPFTVAGHLRSALGPGSAAPVASSCGTGPAVAPGSTDTAGSVTTGSGGTTCTLTFNHTFTTAPVCVMSAATVAGLPAFTVSATAITASTTVASTKYNYICAGIGSGS